MPGLVDIIMPVYNAALYLEESIDSILTQTFSDFSFIIIDDGSTDGSWEILQKYAKQDRRIVLLRNEQNSGICISLNKGFAMSKAKYIARMDADDISYHERIAQQVDFMEKNPLVGVCGCAVRCIDSNNTILYEKKYATDDATIRKQLFLFNPITHSGAIIRKESFDNTEGYNDTYILAEDLALRFAIGKDYTFANLSARLLDYRVYNNNSSHKQIGKMIYNTIKTRKRAIKKYGYKPSALGYILLYTLPLVQLFPVQTIHKLFYFLRSLLYNS